MYRARIDAVTDQGVWVVAADLGTVGPVDCIGTPVPGEPALLVPLSDTDMILVCR